MKIAVTHQMGQVFQHFGHSEQFKFYEVTDGEITKIEIIDGIHIPKKNTKATISPIIHSIEKYG